MNCSSCGAHNEAGATSCSTCGGRLEIADATPGHHLPEGTPLHGGDFTIRGTLGAGGFGITYQADDNRLQRAVAIKEFFPPYCARVDRTVQPGSHLQPGQYEDARAGFLQEATTLARFRHPGIVAVYSVFEENNTVYMVMEFLQGRNLLQLLQERGGRLAENDAVEMIRHVAASLSEVHEAGLLHRDIKPDNILLAGEDRVVLIDFGTAREFDIEHTGNQSRIVTPGYAPLEQYAPRARRGPFSDIYALSATLYHLVTGQPPAPATDRAAGVSLVPARQLNSSLSRGLEAALSTGLEVPIDRRPQSVAAFLQFLEQRHLVAAPDEAAAAVVSISESSAGSNLLKHSAPLSRTYKDSPEPALGRRRLIPALAIVVFLVGGFSLYLFARAPQPVAITPKIEGDLPPLRELKVTGTFGGSRPNDEATVDLPSRYGASFSSDGKLLAGDQQNTGSVVLWDTSTTKRRVILPGGKTGVALQTSVFAPNGKILATVRAPSPLKVSTKTPTPGILVDWWNPANGKRLHSLTGLKSCATSVVFSPDSHWFAVALRDNRKSVESISIYDVTSHKLIHSMQGNVARQSLDPAMINYMDFDPGRAVADIPAQLVQPPAIDFTPDGSALVYGGGDGIVRFWSVKTGALVRQLDGFQDSIQSLALSHDGKTLAVAVVVWPAAPRGMSRTIAVADAYTGKKLWRTFGRGPFRFAGDDSTFACLDDRNQAVKRYTVDGQHCLDELNMMGSMNDKIIAFDYQTNPNVLRATGAKSMLYTWLVN